jgi:hypothetical protein
MIFKLCMQINNVSVMILSYLLSNMNIKNLNLGRVYTKKLGEQFNTLLHIFTAESI